MFSQAMLVAIALSQQCIVWCCLDSGCRDILTNELLGGIHHPQYHTGIHNPQSKPSPEAGKGNVWGFRTNPKHFHRTTTLFIRVCGASSIQQQCGWHAKKYQLLKLELSILSFRLRQLPRLWHPILNESYFCVPHFSRISTSYFKAHSHQWCIVNLTEIWFLGRRLFLLLRKKNSATWSYWSIQ